MRAQAQEGILGMAEHKCQHLGTATVSGLRGCNPATMGDRECHGHNHVGGAQTGEQGGASSWRKRLTL